MTGGMSDYYSGSMNNVGGFGMGGPGSRMMYMNYHHLNTIEEEKHETQTSHYFREGDESQRDDSKIQSVQIKGSRILADLSQDLNQSKNSPHRN